MSIHYRILGEVILVLGNTYPQRERIKAMGGRYHAGDRVWRLPYDAATLEQLASLCRELGGGPLADKSAALNQASSKDAASPKVEGVKASTLPALLPKAAPQLPALAMNKERGLAASGGSALAQLASGHDGSLSVRQLMDLASAAIAQTFRTAVWVVGEVQNAAARPSGHYFDLAEGRSESHHSATTTVRAVIFSSSLGLIKNRHGSEVLAGLLQDGMQIRVLARVQLYKDRGSLSLVVEDLDPSFTMGALALQREKLLKELRAKGLDQANRKLPMPPMPFAIGLITAEGSRALTDFLDQLRSGGYPGRVVHIPTPMQGENVPTLVAAALAQAERLGLDLVVITRGGGSAADLRWFDAREIAYAIAAAKIPVVAAIGHHEDVCIAEEIAWIRQKTPTAAADFVLELFAKAKERITRATHALAQLAQQKLARHELAHSQLGDRLASTFARGLARQQQLLQSQSHRLISLSTRTLSKGQEHSLRSAHALAAASARVLSRASQDVVRLNTELSANFARHWQRQDSDLRHQATTLSARAETQLLRTDARLAAAFERMRGVDPRPWLKRGMTQLLGAKGPLRHVSEALPGQLLHARLEGGVLALRVDSTTINNNTTKPED